MYNEIYYAFEYALLYGYVMIRGTNKGSEVVEIEEVINYIENHTKEQMLADAMKIKEIHDKFKKLNNAEKIVFNQLEKNEHKHNHKA